MRKINSREVGLEIGLLVGRYFLKTGSLHYGYWTDNLKLDVCNLPKAQENYDNFIISNIPDGIKSILDVGCGSGNLSLKLIDKGCQVDCVSPGILITEYARNRMQGNCHVFESTYEDLKTDKRYDIVLFSESFQYINLEQALQKTFSVLNKGGYLLICDFFKTEAVGESFLGGGHRLKKFYNIVSQYSFTKVKDIDITKETAPNHEIVNDILQKVGFPIWNLVLDYLKQRYPLISKLLHWKFRKKQVKINQKYFSGKRNPENFSIFKSYRFLLYKKVDSN